MKTHRLHGRRQPYTQIGIRRLPCFRCGAKAEHQWNICADNHEDKPIFRPICQECDWTLNELVLRWMGFSEPEIQQKMTKYRKT